MPVLLHLKVVQEPFFLRIQMQIDTGLRSSCGDRRDAIDDERRESIVNKPALSAVTNRSIGGAAPSAYLGVIERKAQITPEHLDRLLATHLVPEADLRADDFDAFFAARREALCQLVEKAMGKAVPRDLEQGSAEEDSAHFVLSEIEELPDESD